MPINKVFGKFMPWPPALTTLDSDLSNPYEQNKKIYHLFKEELRSTGRFQLNIEQVLIHLVESIASKETMEKTASNAFIDALTKFKDNFNFTNILRVDVSRSSIRSVSSASPKQILRDEVREELKKKLARTYNLEIAEVKDLEQTLFNYYFESARKTVGNEAQLIVLRMLFLGLNELPEDGSVVLREEIASHPQSNIISLADPSEWMPTPFEQMNPANIKQSRLAESALLRLNHLGLALDKAGKLERKNIAYTVGSLRDSWFDTRDIILTAWTAFASKIIPMQKSLVEESQAAASSSASSTASTPSGSRRGSGTFTPIAISRYQSSPRMSWGSVASTTPVAESPSQLTPQFSQTEGSATSILSGLKKSQTTPQLSRLRRPLSNSNLLSNDKLQAPQLFMIRSLGSNSLSHYDERISAGSWTHYLGIPHENVISLPGYRQRNWAAAEERFNTLKKDLNSYHDYMKGSNVSFSLTHHPLEMMRETKQVFVKELGWNKWSEFNRLAPNNVNDNAVETAAVNAVNEILCRVNASPQPIVLFVYGHANLHTNSLGGNTAQDIIEQLKWLGLSELMNRTITIIGLSCNSIEIVREMADKPEFSNTQMVSGTTRAINPNTRDPGLFTSKKFYYYSFDLDEEENLGKLKGPLIPDLMFSFRVQKDFSSVAVMSPGMYLGEISKKIAAADRLKMHLIDKICSKTPEHIAKRIYAFLGVTTQELLSVTTELTNKFIYTMKEIASSNDESDVNYLIDLAADELLEIVKPQLYLIEKLGHYYDTEDDKFESKDPQEQREQLQLESEQEKSICTNAFVSVVHSIIQNKYDNELVKKIIEIALEEHSDKLLEILFPLIYRQEKPQPQLK